MLDQIQRNNNHHLCHSVASVSLSTVTLCVVAKRCVLEQKLLL